MFEASIIAWIAVAYAAVLSITSMAVSVLFADKLHQTAMGQAIILIFFIGGGLGFIGWTKQRLGDPLVSVACSLASLAIITILTKEGAVQAGDFSFQKISQVMKMVAMGIVMAIAVCFLVFPISAKSKLRQNVIDATDAMGSMFQTISRSFLLGTEEELERTPFVTALELHKKAFTTLPRNLKEAKYEHYIAGTEIEYRIEARLVQCVQRISQSIGGLRSAANMQFTLLKQQQNASGSETPFWTSANDTPSYSGFPSSELVSSSSTSSQEDFGVLSAIRELPEEEHPSEHNGDLIRTVTAEEDVSSPQSPAEIFSRFISYLGPSLVRKC